MSEHDQTHTHTGIVVANAGAITTNHHIIRFKGRAMIERTLSVKDTTQFQTFVPLHKEDFEALAYPLLGGVSRTRISDVFQYVINMAPDFTHHDHLIAFGPSKDFIWNTRTLAFTNTIPYEEVIWRSPYPASQQQGHADFIMSLAGDNVQVYDDILQSLAPMVMERKPDGVIWWIGSGANGKSSLMDALYRIFPHQLASLNVKALTDERDTPLLNGQLANVVKESSEGRIEDTQIYKSIGTHEDFRVHKFHSQDSILINGNVHHIFSANMIPTFNDKGYSARRRTFPIPFTQVFASDPSFNDRTFTQPTLSLIISEMLRYAVRLRDQHYLYKFSPLTTGVQEEYDAEANTAEEYARELVQIGVTGFESFAPVRYDYDNWCADHGFTPLGIANLRRAVQAVGFERSSYRDQDNRIAKRYTLPAVPDAALTLWGMSKPGFYTAPGFRTTKEEPIKTPEPKQASMTEDW